MVMAKASCSVVVICARDYPGLLHTWEELQTARGRFFAVSDLGDTLRKAVSVAYEGSKAI